jgi:hypothetical protein
LPPIEKLVGLNCSLDVPKQEYQLDEAEGVDSVCFARIINLIPLFFSFEFDIYIYIYAVLLIFLSS